MSYTFASTFFFQGTTCEDYLKIFIECFFIYMYTVSIVWMVVEYVAIHRMAKKEEKKIKQSRNEKRKIVSNFNLI